MNCGSRKTVAPRLPVLANGARYVLTALFLVFAFGHDASAASAADAETARLVASISDPGDSHRHGAGIILGTDGDTVYVVTGHHVFAGRQEPNAHLLVQFGFAPNRRFSAQLVDSDSSHLDLDVLRVRTTSDLQHEIANLPFDRLGDPTALGRGDVVHSLTRTRTATMEQVAGTVIRSNPERRRLYYQSQRVEEGYAGGALINESGELVGMVLGVGPTEGEAVEITPILAAARTWGYPIKLGALLRPDHFVSLAVGESHMCGLTENGAAYCWGENSFGQLGNGNLVHRTRSKRVLGNHKFSALTAGDTFVCGLAEGARIYCWGHNAHGELGHQTTENTSVPTAVASTLTFRAVAAPTRGWYACGLTIDGSTYCWGDMSWLIGSSSREPIRIAADLRIAGLTVGDGHACGITTGGLSYCWGSWGHLSRENLNFAEPARIAGDHNFTALSAGAYHVCGIAHDGLAQCWGDNTWNQLGNGSKDASAKPTAVSGGHLFMSITSGQTNTCGLIDDGRVYCWGSNNFGQLGNGSHSASPVPTLVSGNVRFKSISAGGASTCGLTREGGVYCWGAGWRDALDTGFASGSSVPVAIRGLP